MDIVLGLIAGALLCCCVLLTIGCVCHLFKRHGFSSFEDEVESGHGVSMYPTSESSTDMSVSSVTFEPLPDILAKTVGSRALRPRITCIDKQRQAAAAKLVTVYQPFLRSQLFYVKETGLGWFGQVLQGEADRVSPDGHRTKVIVKILKDDASPADKKLFLEEVNPYREIDHPNMLKLLGQCTETLPFLAIMEFPPLGDLKSYLLSQGKGPYIKLAIDAASGLSCLHKNGFVHHDFAARNCLLMADMTLKIGDCGIGEDLFREDYYDTGCDLLPVRWMSPESLCVKNGVWQLSTFTSQSNVWSFSVMLWEILAHGRKPYSNMKDEEVLQRVVSSGHVKLPPPSSDIPLHDRWYEVMEMCWQEADDRPTADDILAFLQQIDEESSMQPNSPKHSVQRQRSSDSDKIVLNGPSTPTHGFSTTILSPKAGKHSTQHVAEVLVHRVDDTDFVSRNNNTDMGFEDDFSKVNIRKNTTGDGFEDDFVLCNEGELSQNDSILAYGGNASEVSETDISDRVKHISTDPNMNLLTEPVPVVMSTPSKQNDFDQLNLPDTRTNQSELFRTAVANQGTQSSSAQYLTAMDTNSSNSSVSKSVAESEINSKHLTENQNDEGYRTDPNRTPDIIVSTNLTDLHEPDNIHEPSVDENMLSVNDSSRTSDPETERAKEIYISKGAALPPSSVHKSRSLGTIPEDGIPSDNTSQSGVVFDEPMNEEIGQGFEWDDYIGEQLVGRVRYTSDESPRPNEEFTEWTFDQDSGSEASNSKPGSIASESDGEDDQLMRARSNVSSTSSDPGSLDIPDIVVVEPYDKMLKNTNKAAV